ncbi:MAG: hypothetical protein IGBAC_1851 [Ignavibacteriae bacterium]|nr:MAG: hypothetical protein IGBAC_1851 [Ignavibacteriota bacterium]
MKSFISKLNIKQKLAAVALLLGIIAIFAGNPYKDAYAKIDTKEIALIIQKELDHITAEELADWIIQGKSDYRLIDLRSEKEFEEYHIPTAENIQLTMLSDYTFLPAEKIILYSEGGIHSAQAWFLLVAKGYRNAYMLKGGLEEWKDKILFPTISQNPSPDEVKHFEKIKEVSKYFGGSPQTGKEENVTIKQTLPKLEMPKQVTPQVGTQKKKKKEGC